MENKPGQIGDRMFLLMSSTKNFEWCSGFQDDWDLFHSNRTCVTPSFESIFTPHHLCWRCTQLYEPQSKSDNSHLPLPACFRVTFVVFFFVTKSQSYLLVGVYIYTKKINPIEHRTLTFSGKKPRKLVDPRQNPNLTNCLTLYCFWCSLIEVKKTFCNRTKDVHVVINLDTTLATEGEVSKDRQEWTPRMFLWFCLLKKTAK